MSQVKTKKQGGIVSYIVEFIPLLIIVFIIRTFGFGLYQVPTGSMETTMLVGERFFADKFSYIFRKPQRGDIIAFNDPEFEYSESSLVSLFQRYVWGPSNWTKRVICVPGDRVRGTIEDGKPVVYVNDQKLHEPYINKYPLVHVWRQDFDDLRSQIEQELEGIFRGRMVDQSVIEKVINQKLSRQTTWRSYDPQLSYEMQQFYRINEQRVITNEEGNPTLLWPGTLIRPKTNGILIESTRNHWDGSDQFYVKLGPDEYWCMGDNRLGSKDCRVFGPIAGKQIHGRIIFRSWSIDSYESFWRFDLIKHPMCFWSRIRWNRFFQQV